MAKRVAYLEIPITHRCNFRCDGCSAYSNYALREEASAAEIEEWMRELSAKIRPEFIRILGGEPFMHPELGEILKIVRESNPESRIQVVTNGLLLVRENEYLKAIETRMREATIGLWVSVHSREAWYSGKLRKALTLLERWKEDGIEIGLGNNILHWNRFYRGAGECMIPYEEGDPEKSYGVCHSKHCVNLVRARLWKCPQIGNLRILSEKFPLNAKYDEYLKYAGISVYASQEEVVEFIERKAEWICGMCPGEIVDYEKQLR